MNIDPAQNVTGRPMQQTPQDDAEATPPIPKPVVPEPDPVVPKPSPLPPPPSPPQQGPTGAEVFPAQTTPEVQPVQEIYTPPEAPKPTPVQPQQPLQKPEDKTPTIQPQQNEAPPEKVVDKRTGHEELHKVSPNADKLTTIADVEEEEFIKEVEEHHGSGPNAV